MSAADLLVVLKDINETMMTKCAHRITEQLSEKKGDHLSLERKLFLTMDKNVQQLVDYITTSLLAVREELGPSRVSSLLLGIAGRCTGYNQHKEKVYHKHLVKVKKLEDEFSGTVESVLREELEGGHHSLDGIYADALAHSQQYFEGQHVQEFSMEHSQHDERNYLKSRNFMHSYDGVQSPNNNGNKQLNQKQSIATHSVFIDPKVLCEINGSIETVLSSASVPEVPNADDNLRSAATQSSLAVVDILKMIQTQSESTDKSSVSEVASHVHGPSNSNILHPMATPYRRKPCAPPKPPPPRQPDNEDLFQVSRSNSEHLCSEYKEVPILSQYNMRSVEELQSKLNKRKRTLPVLPKQNVDVVDQSKIRILGLDFEEQSGSSKSHNAAKRRRSK